MAHDEPGLVACEECGALNETATLLLDQAREQVALLERDLRGKRSRISALERDRKTKLQTSKRFQEAMVVLRHWKDVCAPKAREIDSPERVEAVIARLNGGHTVEELKLSASGYARRPYVTREGRSATGTASQWFADAELIYRNPENVRKGIAWAAPDSGSTSTSPTTLDERSIARLSWRRVQSANRALIVRALEEQFGKGLDDGYGIVAWPCPRCDNHPASTLRVAPSGMTWLATCSSCGLDETRLIAAITGDK
jgi:hypothetical protein